MTTPIVGSTSARLSVGTTRTRQTLQPKSRFVEVLRTGADILLAGAGVASGLVGGPLLSAAVGAASGGLRQLGGSSSGGSGSGSGSSGLGALGASGGGGGLQGSGVGPVGSTGSGGSDIDAVRQLQKEGQAESMKFLKLQQEMQAENRRFSLASTVLKAKHDTARSVIGNIRV